MKDNDEELVNENYKKSKWSSFFRAIILIIVTAVITHFCTITFTIKSYLNKSDMTYLATKLSIIRQKLDQNYIYDAKEEDMIESAIKGYVAGVGDKYTQYLTKDDMKSLYESTTGSYVGIGVYMANNTQNDTIDVIGVIEGSVAESAGIKVGDVITKVNDIEYKGSDIEKISEVIKGEEGTEVKVTINRNSEIIDFNMTRANIKVKSVGNSMIDDIAYIEIVSFNDGTAAEFRDAYYEVKKNNPKGLIIDLRNNGGGLVNESLDVAETMVEKGKTLLITAAKDKKEKIDKAKENPIVDIPVVILINENTASASEILAGCLRDNCNYKIIGTTSYGKGVIQSIMQFSDGTGLKVTMEEYFTPNHNEINKIGIEPDIVVEQDTRWNGSAYVPLDEDLQIKKAIEIME